MGSNVQDDEKAKEQLLQEVRLLRRRLAQLEKYRSKNELQDKVQGESAERYYLIFENMQEGMAYCQMLFDDQGQPVDWVYLEVNPAFTRLTGLQNVIGKRITELIPGIKELQPEPFEIYGRVALTGQPEQFEIYFKPLQIWLNIKAYSPAPEHFVAVFGDITSRKRTEESLRQSEATFRLLYNRTPVMHHSINSEGKIIMVSDYWLETMGYGREEALGRHIGDFMTVESRREALEVNLPSFMQTGYVRDIEYRFVKKSGEIMDVLLSSILERGAAGNFVRSMGVVVDITERKRTEAALQESTARFRSLFDSMTEGVALHELIYDDRGLAVDYRIIAVNPAFEKHTGLKPAQVVGQLASSAYGTSPAPYLETYAQVTFSGQAYAFETYFPPMQRHFHISVTTPKPGQFVTVFEDITEKQRLAEALQASEALLKEAQRIGHMGSWTVNLPDYTFQWSDEMYYIFGVAREELPLIFEAFMKRIYPEDQPLMARWVEQAVGQLQPKALEFRIVRPDGTVRHIRGDGELITDRAGKPERLVGTAQDITERKRAEVERDRLFKFSIEMLCIAGFDGYFKQVNPAGEKLLGWTDQELVSKPWIEFVHPEDRAASLVAMAQLAAGEAVYAFENRYQCQDGSYRWFSWNAFPVVEEDLIFCVARDETERKQAEEALSQSRQRLKSIFRVAPVGIGLVFNRVIQEANETLCRMTGYSREQLVGQNARMLYPSEEDYNYVGAEKYRQIAEGGTGSVETRWKRQDGEIIDLILSSIPLDATDLSKGVTFTALDITERKQAEKALQDNEQFLTDIFDSIQDGLSILDPELNIIRVNPAMEKFGYAQPMAGRKCYAVYHDRSSPCKVCPTQETLRTGKACLKSVRGHPTDGARRFLEIRTFPLKDRTSGQIQAVIEYVRDVTEIKQAGAERLRFSKLESLATLAGGIAHDFNNILTAILGNIGLATLELQDEELSRERLTDAERACLQAQTLARQLLTFAKGGTPVKEPIAVEKVITELASFSCRGSQVRCEFSFPDNLWAAEADPGQINQVFQNLIINAMQAMPTGGTISIRGENLVVAAGSQLFLDRGRYVKISVADQGVGMPEDYLAKIFDPYFTTKQKGSGLGLATVYSILKNHHGHISVQSEIGVGTVFEVYLPASDKNLTLQPAEDRGLLTGKGKVLVMDDEELVRRVLGRMLTLLGYEAKFASDGKEAIEQFSRAQESGEAFAAVILDLTVPGGMGGKEVIEKLLEIDPRVKAIVSSGYSEAPIMAEYEKYGFSGILAKPYRVPELGKILHKAIFEKI